MRIFSILLAGILLFGCIAPEALAKMQPVAFENSKIYKKELLPIQSGHWRAGLIDFLLGSTLVHLFLTHSKILVLLAISLLALLGVTMFSSRKKKRVRIG